MRHFLMNGLIAASIGVMSVAPARAFPAAPAGVGIAAPHAQIEHVQYRRHWGRHHHRRGFGVGAGIAGLAAGAIIGGAIANSQAPAYYGTAPADDDSAVAYCLQRFRSYDPARGTYLGYDGLRHPCP
ncbi:MAG TPA: BA14K family protein [Beijerinckiaceae bacterium]|nr:BA14K family protein [Rhodoblastus sp.]HRY04410.1 BA14K family protein [Beijerinckiaceae bacterium]